MVFKELRELQINTNNVVMASFDVKSLFTNIPLDETISIIINISVSIIPHAFTVSQLINSLDFLTYL
jgi:hypothetical protein